MSAEMQLIERLVYEVGPMGTLLGLGFYWLRRQLDTFGEALTDIKDLSREQEYTQACVSMIAKVQGIPLPKRKETA